MILFDDTITNKFSITSAGIFSVVVMLYLTLVCDNLTMVCIKYESQSFSNVISTKAYSVHDGEALMLYC